MPRMIALYEKTGENLVNRLELLYDDLDFFANIVGSPPGDPLLYGVYKIDNKMNRKIFAHLGIRLDLTRYDAFIEYGEDLT